MKEETERPSQKQFFSKDKKSAFESKNMAQWIAFGPVVFQAARVLRDSGILETLEQHKQGLTIEELTDKVKMSHYGVRVLLESGLGIGLVLVNNRKFTITKTGFYILRDQLTKVNMDFVQDICYKPMFSLEKSIETGKPEGLKEFGDWSTVYEGLSALPKQLQTSWFNFDHFFSDDAFPHVLPKVYDGRIKKIVDIGGNTGKWAIASTKFDKNVHVTIVDLPGQLAMAQKKVAEAGLSAQVSFIEANVLNETQPFPKGHDAIWLSQFLDCFSDNEIISILKRCHDALDADGCVLILEPFWDRQRFEAASFCLQQTSLYFTAIANGNSQMYSFETFSELIAAAGFEIT